MVTFWLSCCGARPSAAHLAALGVETRHRDIDAGLVDAREAAHVEGGTQAAVACTLRKHARGITLRGMDQLFLYGSRRRRTADTSWGH